MVKEKKKLPGGSFLFYFGKPLNNKNQLLDKPVVFKYNTKLKVERKD
jgi:hypothetical protein